MSEILSIVISIIGASGILGIGTRAIIFRLKQQEDKQQALEHGVQALLRDRMLTNFNRYTERGYAPLFAKENFENMYQQYHNLGGNGVMTRLYSEFMELSTESEEKQK